MVGSARQRVVGAPRKSRRSLAIFAAVFAVGSASADPPGHSAFRTYGLDEGLTNLAVLSLTQDQRGVMWVGTEDGLFSYDGQRFTRYGATDGLPVGAIVELATDAQGAVLVGTERGLGRVVDGKASTVSEVPARRVASLAIEAQGCSWVCVEQPTEGLWRSCGGQPYAPVEGWGSGACTSISVGAPGELLVATPAGLSTHQSSGAWTHQPVDWRGERIDVVARDGSGRLWARSLSRVLVAPPGESTFRFADDDLPRAYLDGHLTVGPDGEVWVATVAGVAHRRGDTWDLLGERAGLRGLVNAIFFDSEGSVWFGGLGLHRWLGSGHLRSTTHVDGLPNDNVWAIARHPDGSLLVGTDEGLSQGTAERWTPLPFATHLGIKALAPARDGTLWLGASPLQVLHWAPATGALERYGAADGLAGSQVASAVVDAEGTLWVGTERGGLFGSRQGPGGKVRFAPAELPDSVPTEIVSSLALDAQGRVWAAGSEGLAVREGGRWRRFTAKDGLPETYQAFVAPRAAGGMWVAGWSSTGVLPASLENGKLVLGEALLVGRKVYFLGEDARHRLYVGTGSGLAIVQRGTVTELTQNDGLPGDDCDANSFWADPDGVVWVGTSTGLARLDAARDWAPPAPPRTIIERARLGGRSLDGAAATVEHTENTLEVHFAAMSYVNEKKVRYRTRLVGLSSEWRESPLPEERFTNLPPGSYLFEAQAGVGDGQWGAPAQASFVVRPAFWQTGWARAAMLAALLGLVALTVRWRRAAAEGARSKRASDELLRSVFGVIREGVLVREPSGALTIWNTAAEDIIGLSGPQLTQDVPPPPGWRLLREDGSEVAPNERPGHLTRVTGKPEPVQLVAFPGTDGPRWALVSTEPVLAAERGPGPWPTVTTISDVTEQVRAREKLRTAMEASNEASKLKSQFLANMSHEIRTPLNAVLGLTRLAKDEPLTPRLAEYLELIERSGDDLLGLVNDLLDFSKIEAGKLTLERIPFSVKDLLGQLERVFAPALAAKGLRIERRTGTDVGEQVLGDPLRVRQVLTNLLSNAIKFTVREGTIALAAHREGDEVRFEVTDTGIGMTEEQVSRLFEAFRQGDATTTRRFGGTGLGLAISRSLARAMGGDLEVQSAEGRGSTFAFHCPLPATVVTAPVTSVVRVPEGLRGRRVLLVDDNSVNRLVGRALLLKAGIEVTMAEDGEHGLVMACNAPEPFDAVLMDVQMPVMDGYQTTAELRRRLGERTPPVIAVTAHAMVEQRAESEAAGMVAHVTKPIDPAELYAVLERLFSSK